MNFWSENLGIFTSDILIFDIDKDKIVEFNIDISEILLDLILMRENLNKSYNN